MKRLVSRDNFQVIFGTIFPIVSKNCIYLRIDKFGFNNLGRCIEVKIFSRDLEWMMRLRGNVCFFWLTEIFKRIFPSSWLDVFD